MLLAHVLDLLLALLLVELLLHRLVKVIAALLVSWGTLLLRNISLGGFAFLVNLMNSFCLKISLNAQVFLTFVLHVLSIFFLNFATVTFWQTSSIIVSQSFLI